MPVLINTFGSEPRMNLAFEAESMDAVAERVQEIIDFESPEGIVGKMKMLPRLAEMAGIFPKMAKSGPCQEIVKTGDEVDLRELPIIKCWPEDGGRFVTLPLVFTKNPENGKRNCGMYRMQLFDRRTTAMPRITTASTRPRDGERRWPWPSAAIPRRCTAASRRCRTTSTR
jgi:4-hydroxy-3-polyprenylbenzoate decarboxylase